MGLSLRANEDARSCRETLALAGRWPQLSAPLRAILSHHAERQYASAASLREAFMLKFASTLSLAIAVAVSALTTVAKASSSGIDTIDCNARLNRAETTICSSQRLQILDAKITEIYADMMLGRRLSSSGKEMLRDSQYNFLARRNSCGADYACLEEIMSQRAGRIRNYY
jgi:uncharacterized protein YecT (DUF1311 family)